MVSVAGFVLTGGMSTRMGRDKALLPFGGETLCEHVGDILSPLCQSVLLVGHPERYGHLKYQCIPDRRPDLGPLSGLDAALNAVEAEYYILAACDFVNIQRAWLSDLLLTSKQAGGRCAALEDSAGKVQPLCAVYRSESRNIVACALKERRLRMMDLLAELGAQPVKVDGLALNLNTPEDYADYRKQPLY